VKEKEKGKEAFVSLHFAYSETVLEMPFM